MSELLPCPFCGNSDMDADEGVFHFPKRDNRVESWEVRCGNPGCASMDDETREKAVARWNRRAAAPQPTEPSIGIAEVVAIVEGVARAETHPDDSFDHVAGWCEACEAINRRLSALTKRQLAGSAKL